MDHIYDVIILGAGPAGLSAGLYAGRSRLDTLIIEKDTYQAKNIIIATDAYARPIGCKGEQEYKDAESLTVQPVMRTSLLTWKSM